MQIFHLDFYFEKGEFNRIYYGLKDFDRFYHDTGHPFKIDLFFYKYLLLHPEKYQDVELPLIEKRSKNRYDVEYIAMNGMYCTSEKFKNVCNTHNIPFDFFPIKVEGERRYIMMCRRLPVISEFKLDVKASKIKERMSRDRDVDDATEISIKNWVFRSDIMEYFGYKVFSERTFNYILPPMNLKKYLNLADFFFHTKNLK